MSGPPLDDPEIPLTDDDKSTVSGVYVATNLSSRTFICGDLMLYPKIPVGVTEEQKLFIERSHYGSYFVFVVNQ